MKAPTFASRAPTVTSQFCVFAVATIVGAALPMTANAQKKGGGGGGGSPTLQATQISGTYRVTGIFHCFSTSRNAEDFSQIEASPTVQGEHAPPKIVLTGAGLNRFFISTLTIKIDQGEKKSIR